MTNETDAQQIDQIAAKEAHIEHYKGVLDRYESGRWLSQGKRYLEQLEAELAELKANQIIKAPPNDSPAGHLGSGAEDIAQ